MKREETMKNENSNTPLGVTNTRAACRLVAAEFFGPEGLWLFDTYEALNRQLFAGKLPTALCTIELTAHGGCLGLTQKQGEGPPRVKLHPSTFGGTEKPDPWDIPKDILGPRYALDVLIHEMVHVSVLFVLGGIAGASSHNCPRWRSELERIAPLVGLDGFTTTSSKTKRVETGKLNDKGRPIKTVRRVHEGELPYSATYGFPHVARMVLGMEDYYRHGRLPLDIPDFPETRH